MNEQEQYDEMVRLYSQVNDYFLHRFMKLNHTNMDMKIRVLRKRLAGMTPPEIGEEWDRVQEED